MTTKLVIRLLTADGAMLGWEQHEAAMPGDGTLRAASDVRVPVDVSGTVALISAHWCDVNVEIRVPLAHPMDVKAGDTVTAFQRGALMVEAGPAAGGLPPIATRSHVAVTPNTGGMGATGQGPA